MRKFLSAALLVLIMVYSMSSCTKHSDSLPANTNDRGSGIDPNGHTQSILIGNNAGGAMDPNGSR